MEATRKYCLNCKTYFTSKRMDKKYCSDTCRQMAYFKRNGLTLVNPQTLQNVNSPRIVDVKYDPDTPQQELVKDTSFLETPNLELLIMHLSDTWEQKLNQRIEGLREEFNVKYANPVAKVQQDTGSISETNQPVDYKTVKPNFVKYIDKAFEMDEDSYKLEKPLSYWSAETVKAIRWVNPRLRCLLESLIKLSAYSSIDQHTLVCVHDAFMRLQGSKSYQCLPNSYPFKNMVAGLTKKVSETYTKNKQGDKKIRIRFPLADKVNMIYTRHLLKRTTLDLKFSQLHFNE